MTHYHYGYGLAGYGPQGETADTCRDLDCLQSCVSHELGVIADSWHEQAHAERSEAERLHGMRPANGADPGGYPGSWESIATAALRALECLDRADVTDTMIMNLRAERRYAPLYHDRPELWAAEQRQRLLDSGTYPMSTDITGNNMFYVWSCGDWHCLLSEHDAGYRAPLASTTGGYALCACRDCMETLVWSPGTGEAPYCPSCTDADCPARERGECSATH